MIVNHIDEKYELGVAEVDHDDQVVGTNEVIRGTVEGMNDLCYNVDEGETQSVQQ